MIPQFEHKFSEKRFYNFDENLSQPRHRWYPFKEGFSNQLVREAIAHIPQKRRLSVLDPFCGSGTTPLVASVLGHSAVGIEVNPFCAFASSVKCSKGRWKPESFRKEMRRLIERVKCHDAPSQLEEFSSFSNAGASEKWLFEKSVVRAATFLIDTAKDERCTYTGAFVLSAIRAAMMCCNAKKDGKCLRYLKDWRVNPYTKADFLTAFERVAEQIIGDISLARIPDKGDASILVGDSRLKLATLRARSTDIIVTSPPYLNSFDYSDVYRPEMFLGGFVKNNEDLREVRVQTLRSHVQVAWPQLAEMKNPLVRAFSEQLRGIDGLWSSRLPDMIDAYFEDMGKVLLQCARVLKKGGQAWIVVSTSSYYGVHIPVDALIGELGSQSGMSLEGIYVLRNLRGSGQQRVVRDKALQSGLPLRESLIIFKR